VGVGVPNALIYLLDRLKDEVECRSSMPALIVLGRFELITRDEERAARRIHVRLALECQGDARGGTANRHTGGEEEGGKSQFPSDRLHAKLLSFRSTGDRVPPVSG
jgi:hypothetical protein